MAEFEQHSGQQVHSVELSGNTGVNAGVVNGMNVYGQEAARPDFSRTQLAISTATGEVIGLHEVPLAPKSTETDPSATPESDHEKLTAIIEEILKERGEQDKRIEALLAQGEAQAKQIEVLLKQLAAERRSRAAEKAAAARQAKAAAAGSQASAPAAPAPTPAPAQPSAPASAGSPGPARTPNAPKAPKGPKAPESSTATGSTPGTAEQGNDPGNNTPELIKLPEELTDLLQHSIDTYADATAKSRNGYIGHFLHESRFLARIPFIRRIAERINRSGDQEVDAARKVYEDTLRQAQKYVGRLIMEQGETDTTLTKEQLYKEVRNRANLLASDSERAFEALTAQARMDRSKPTTRIVNWWVKHDGIGGKLAKFAGVAGVGATVGGFATTLGVIAGIAVPGIGAVAGMAAGAAIGNYVTKRRANAVVDAEGTTLARQHEAEDRAAKQKVIDAANRQEVLIRNPDYDPANPGNEPEFIRNVDSHILAQDMTQLTERRTAQEMRRNRRRIAAAKMAGGLGGGLGEVLTRGVLHSFDAAAQAKSPQIDSPSNPDHAGAGDHPQVAHPDLASSPEHLNGIEFNIETGHGYTNELMDFAQANGHALTPQQAWDLHQNLVGQFGGDYIDIADRAKDVYQTAGGDWRLSAPGAASWSQGVPEAIKSWMSAAGLWQ